MAIASDVREARRIVFRRSRAPLTSTLGGIRPYMLRYRGANGLKERSIPGVFFSHEPNEPPHVHIDREDLSAKFWLQPVALARNFGFSARELRGVRILIAENREILLEAWHGHFSAKR